MDLWRLWDPKLDNKIAPILKEGANTKAIGKVLDSIANAVIKASGIVKMTTKIGDGSKYSENFFASTKDLIKCFESCTKAIAPQITRV